MINKWSNCTGYLHSRFTSFSCFQEFWGPPWPLPQLSPQIFFLLRYSFLARAIQLNVGKPGNGSPTRKGCSTNNINGILDSQGWGWTKSCFFGAENDVRPWFFSAPVGLLALESSDTGHGVGAGVLPLLPYILFWFTERDFAGRSCSFSSTSSFRCILWLLELHISRVQWVVLVWVGRATFFRPHSFCHATACVFWQGVKHNRIEDGAKLIVCSLQLPFSQISCVCDGWGSGATSLESTCLNCVSLPVFRRLESPMTLDVLITTVLLIKLETYKKHYLTCRKLFFAMYFFSRIRPWLKRLGRCFALFHTHTQTSDFFQKQIMMIISFKKTGWSLVDCIYIYIHILIDL